MGIVDKLVQLLSYKTSNISLLDENGKAKNKLPTNLLNKADIHYVNCICGLPQHAIRLVKDPEGGMLMIDVVMNPGFSFLERLRKAILYVISPNTLNVMFTDSEITVDTAKDLVEFVNVFIEETNNIYSK